MESVSPISLSVSPVVNISPLSSLFASSSPLYFPSFSSPDFAISSPSPISPTTLPVNQSTPPPLMPIPSSPRFFNNYKDDRPNQTKLVTRARAIAMASRRKMPESCGGPKNTFYDLRINTRKIWDGWSAVASEGGMDWIGISGPVVGGIHIEHLTVVLI